MKYEYVNFKYPVSWDELRIIPDKNSPIYIYKNFKIGNIGGRHIRLFGKHMLVSNIDQYFHFLKEYLGGFLYVKNIFKDLKYIYIKNNSNIESYQNLNNVIDETVNRLKKYDGQFISNITLEDSFLQIDEFVLMFDHGKSIIEYDRFFNHSGMNDFSIEIRKFYSDLMTEDKLSPKKIYISRRSVNDFQKDFSSKGRKPFRYYDIYMEDALEDFFKKNGYEIVELTNEPIEKQINLFYNATHVAGPLGTGFFNGIFSKPGTKFISVNRDPKYFFDFEGEIKSVIDCEFYYHQLEEHPDYENFRESLDRIIDKEIC